MSRLAVDLGQPRSTLEGRPLQFQAEIVRDSDGAAVGIVGQVESPWTSRDLDVALAVQADGDARCDGCGQLRSESHDPDNEMRWSAETSRCHACAAAARASRQIDDQAGLFAKTWLDDAEG